MFVTDFFDFGYAAGIRVEGSRVIFDLKPSERLLNVLLCEVPPELTLSFLLDEKGRNLIEHQGIILSEDGLMFTAHPLARIDAGTWEVRVKPRGRQIQVASCHPYGRDQLDQLLCDIHGAPAVRPRLLRRDGRTVPVFDCGEDDGRKPVHYLIACEDIGETAAAFAADEMVRTVAAATPAVAELLNRAVLRIVPVVSSFFAARPKGSSYTQLDGCDRYGAATWADAPPPPEYALLRDEVEQVIAQRRLCLLLTLHSWYAEFPTTSIEAIRSAGDNTLSPPRAVAAQQTMDSLMRGVSQGTTKLADRIWHPGLARDYLLRTHNILTYRIELTTHSHGIAQFRQVGRQLLENLAGIASWDATYPSVGTGKERG